VLLAGWRAKAIDRIPASFAGGVALWAQTLHPARVVTSWVVRAFAAGGAGPCAVVRGYPTRALDRPPAPLGGSRCIKAGSEPHD
jgi:hypothetical protein